jgi:hypothetical protein
MRTQEAIDRFKSTNALADALEISPAAISQWGEYPPDKRQLQIQHIAPDLKAEPGCIDRVLGFDPQWDGKTERRAETCTSHKGAAKDKPESDKPASNKGR